jgi:hemerythrin
MNIEWRDQLSVGNDLIDDDHKSLIEIINQAGKALKQKNLAVLTEALDSLQHYSALHFTLEEQIARAVGYDKSDTLHESHGSLLERLSQLKHEIGTEWDDVASEHFGALLRDWLINHVIKEDMLMKPMLKKFSPRFDPR